MLEAFRFDAVQALRRLVRAPRLSVVVILTTAVGIGGVISLFSIFDALVIRHLNVRRPDRLVVISAVDRHGQRGLIPLPTVQQLARLQRVFDGLCGYTGGGLLATEVAGVTALTPVEVVTPEYYTLLGLRPEGGRLLSAQDFEPSADPPRVTVIGYGFWQRVFAGDRGVLGKSLRVEGVPLTVVGVGPRSFGGLGIEVAPDLTLPMSLMRTLGVATNPRWPIRANYLIARLNDGVSIEQAESHVAGLWPAVRDETMPPGLLADEESAFKSLRLHVESIATGFSTVRQVYARPLLMLLVLSAVLLLIACANLGGMLLAEVTSRSPEVTLRAALGGSRRRLTQQVLLDVMAPTLAGSVLAVLLAWWVTRLLGRMMWTGLVPLTLSLSPDVRVVGLTVFLGVLTGLLIGIVPVWRTTSARTLTDLHGGRTVNRTAARVGRSLLVLQIALSVVLCFAATLLSVSLWKIQSVDPGFDPDGEVFGRIFATPGPQAHLDVVTYYPELIRKLSAIPGVRSVSLSRGFPSALVTRQSIAPKDAPKESEITGGMDVVAPSFFGTVGMSVLRGREFDWRDDQRAPQVATISESLSSRLFGTVDSLNRFIRIGDDPTRRAIQIVGVVNDTRVGDLRAAAALMVFRPMLQEPQLMLTPVVHVRGSAPMPIVATSFRATLNDLGRHYIPSILSLREQLNRDRRQERLVALLSTVFAGLTILLALIGVHGLLAYGVARRSREIAVRLAIGIPRSAIAKSVVAEALALTTIGLAIGVPVAIMTARSIQSLFFGISPFNPAALAFTACVFVCTAMASSLLPVLRASSIDPVSALRAE